MSVTKIVWYTAENGNRYLQYHDLKWYEGPEATDAADAAADDLADLCDRDCESDNYHDFVGVHAALLNLIRGELGDTQEATARAIMRKIAESGTLRGMRV